MPYKPKRQIAEDGQMVVGRNVEFIIKFIIMKMENIIRNKLKYSDKS